MWAFIACSFFSGKRGYSQHVRSFLGNVDVHSMFVLGRGRDNPRRALRGDPRKALRGDAVGQEPPGWVSHPVRACEKDGVEEREFFIDNLLVRVHHIDSMT